MKEIKLDRGRLFVINPKTGRWGVSQTRKIDRLEEKLKEPLPKKEYSRTNLLVLNSSNDCNLSCIYCSEREHRNCTPKMPDDLARKIVDRAIDEKIQQTIIFHGSEPTTNFDWITRVVKYGNRRMNETGRKIGFAIQSNLAELPKGFFDFIRKYRIGVSTSIDGTPKIHNRTRPYANGEPSFKDVMGNVKKILKYQGNLNVATVITKFNVRNLKQIADLFESEGITSWQTIPTEKNHSYAPNPIDLGKAYILLFDTIFEKIKSGKQRLEVRALSQYLASMFIHNGIDACRMCSSSNIQPLIAIDYNGEAYPCDYFWGDKTVRIGNIRDQTVNEIVKSPENLRMRDINKTGCSPCTWKMNCGGGCLASSHYSESGKSPYCAAHKVVYNHLAMKMPELIENNLIKPILLWSTK